ncbi:unnamed protein product [Clavelina lepadiformis]|uniref:Uncharacterized protein n=1 Tax=Clavelina lepadiformis TaxID=159417 RepID=A0ABP0FUR7_CLALP
MEALRLMNSTPTSSSYEEIEKLLSCPICLEVFTKPVVILPCQHNLCRKCANDIFQSRGTPMGSGGRFRCPNCRYEVVLDRHGVYGLQRNLLVENIIDMYQSDNRKPSFMKVEQTIMCEEHEDEKVNIYCITCQKPTCSLCKVFGQHKDCTVSPMDKVYKDQKREISDAIAILVSGNDRLQAIVTQTEEIGKMTECNGRTVKTNLCEAFDKLYAILEERKNDLIAKITADVQERNQVLQEMLKNYGQQLEGASKLMEASLALLEERSIPQFLNVSRDMIKQVLAAARASEVRKPPFNIQVMDEFKVNFNSQENLLKQLDFIPTSEDPSSSTQSENDGHPQNRADEPSDKGETRPPHAINQSDSDDEIELTAEDEGADTDDTAATSVTSRSDVGSSRGGRRLSTELGVQASPSRSRHSTASPVVSNSGEQQRRINKEEQFTFPIIKKGRWYDRYVRQLPAPMLAPSLTATPIITSAPMESTAFAKVTIPDYNPDDEKKSQSSDDKPSSPSVNSCLDSDDVDREIEKLLVPRRRRWISSLHSSNEESETSSPRSSPPSILLQRHHYYRSDSPLSRHTTVIHRPSASSPVNFQLQDDAVLKPPTRRHRYSRDDETSSKNQLYQKQSLTSDQPVHNLSRDSSVEHLSQQTITEHLPNSQHRRPRQYGSHRRRTWSHLLDKK